jgi:hypothetical protein
MAPSLAERRALLLRRRRHEVWLHVLALLGAAGASGWLLLSVIEFLVHQ